MEFHQHLSIGFHVLFISNIIIIIIVLLPTLSYVICEISSSCPPTKNNDWKGWLCDKHCIIVYWNWPSPCCSGCAGGGPRFRSRITLLWSSPYTYQLKKKIVGFKLAFVQVSWKMHKNLHKERCRYINKFHT